MHGTTTRFLFLLSGWLLEQHSFRQGSKTHGAVAHRALKMSLPLVELSYAFPFGFISYGCKA